MAVSLTYEETRVGIVRSASNQTGSRFFTKEGAAAETLRVTGPTIGTGVLNQEEFTVSLKRTPGGISMVGRTFWDRGHQH
jgi:hypothetical protein